MAVKGSYGKLLCCKLYENEVKYFMLIDDSVVSKCLRVLHRNLINFYGVLTNVLYCEFTLACAHAISELAYYSICTLYEQNFTSSSVL